MRPEISEWSAAFAQRQKSQDAVDAPETPTDSTETEAEEHKETLWRPGFLICLLGSFIAPMTTTMCIVFFVKLAEKALVWKLDQLSW